MRSRRRTWGSGSGSSRASSSGERPARAHVVAAEQARTVVIARRLDEVEAIRAAWQTFDLPTVHHDIDFYLAKVRSRPEILRPHVVLLERDGQPEALAIGRLEESALECRVGYATVYRPTLRLLVMRPGVLLQADSETVGRALITQLVACLARGEADALSFYGLDTDGAIYRNARGVPGFLCRERFVHRERHWKLTLPDSMDAFLASRSRHARSELRGLDRRLARKYGDRLRVKVFRSSEEMDRLFADLDRVAAKTYQRALYVAFADTEEERDTIGLALSRGWFRAYVLYLDDQPIAYRSGFLYGGTFTGSDTGYDFSYRKDRVGTYLLIRLVEDLCKDEAVQNLDYGGGDADYKRRFASSGSDEAHPMIFAPTFRGIRTNVLKATIYAAAELGTKALDRAGMLESVKKRWREGLSRID
jgi:CelD/BcsL family acetyltransferase involved in cellulose biosynthesis